MNRVLELVGGHPLQLDDLEWIQNNVQLITSALANSVSDSDFLLYGGQISVSDSGGANPLLTITEGALWNSDEKEIYLIDSVVDFALLAGTTLQDVLTLWEWDKVATYSGSRTFSNGATKLPLETEVAILTETPSTWTGIVADLITAREVQSAASNLDIVNSDYENPGVFDLLYDNGNHQEFRRYDLVYGQHILRLLTPSVGLCTLAQITPPADVYDGYELVIDVKEDTSSISWGLGFFVGNFGGLVTSNLNLASNKIITDIAGTLTLKDWNSYYVAFAIGATSFTDIYVDNGKYDICTQTGGRFKLLLRWNAVTSLWDEVSRTKHLS